MSEDQPHPRDFVGALKPNDFPHIDDTDFALEFALYFGVLNQVPKPADSPSGRSFLIKTGHPTHWPLFIRSILEDEPEEWTGSTPEGKWAVWFLPRFVGKTPLDVRRKLYALRGSPLSESDTFRVV